MSTARLRFETIPEDPALPRRREGARFPVCLAVEYVVNGCKRTGWTANMSGRGIYILTADIVPVNKPIRLRIEWPAMLEGRCPLCLAVKGRVSRIDRYGMAVRIERYEFRLRPIRQLASG